MYRKRSLIESLLKTPCNGHVCTSLCVGDGGFLSDATRRASNENNFATVCLVCKSFFGVNRRVNTTVRISGVREDEYVKGSLLVTLRHGELFVNTNERVNRVHDVERNTASEENRVMGPKGCLSYTLFLLKSLLQYHHDVLCIVLTCQATRMTGYLRERQ